MKAAIIGTRGMYFEIDKYILEAEEYLKDKITMIITGGASGVDTLAEEYANRRGITKQIFLPDYRLGKAAPLIRNKDIVKNADIVIAFWDGESRGTRHAINYAKIYNKKVLIFKLMRTDK